MAPPLVVPATGESFGDAIDCQDSAFRGDEDELVFTVQPMVASLVEAVRALFTQRYLRVHSEGDPVHVQSTDSMPLQTHYVHVPALAPSNVSVFCPPHLGVGIRSNIEVKSVEHVQIYRAIAAFSALCLLLTGPLSLNTRILTQLSKLFPFVFVFVSAVSLWRATIDEGRRSARNAKMSVSSGEFTCACILLALSAISASTLWVAVHNIACDAQTKQLRKPVAYLLRPAVYILIVSAGMAVSTPDRIMGVILAVVGATAAVHRMLTSKPRQASMQLQYDGNDSDTRDPEHEQLPNSTPECFQAYGYMTEEQRRKLVQRTTETSMHELVESAEGRAWLAQKHTNLYRATAE